MKTAYKKSAAAIERFQRRSPVAYTEPRLPPITMKVGGDYDQSVHQKTFATE